VHIFVKRVSVTISAGPPSFRRLLITTTTVLSPWRWEVHPGSGVIMPWFRLQRFPCTRCELSLLLLPEVLHALTTPWLAGRTKAWGKYSQLELCDNSIEFAGSTLVVLGFASAWKVSWVGLISVSVANFKCDSFGLLASGSPQRFSVLF
jgi:hypothetical protein